MPNFKMIGPVVSEIYHLPQLRALGCPAHPRSPRGRATGKKKNLSWSQRYLHAKFQNDWSCSFRDLTLAPAACPRSPRGCAAGKKNLSWSQRYPHAKFQNDWSCSFRDHKGQTHKHIHIHTYTRNILLYYIGLDYTILYYIGLDYTILYYIGLY